MHTPHADPHPRPVLIVEDDRATRDMYEAAVKEAGFRVISVADGGSARAALRTTAFSAVILDLDVPVVSGAILIEELALNPRSARIPVIVTTGTELIPRMPPSAMLLKPVDGARLVETLQSVLQRTTLGM